VTRIGQQRCLLIPCVIAMTLCALFTSGASQMPSTPLGTFDTSSVVYPSKENGIYEDKSLGSKLSDLLTETLKPVLPAGLVLMLFTAFFSAIDFYSALRPRFRILRRTYLHLTLWLAGNWIFTGIGLGLAVANMGLELSPFGVKLLGYLVVIAALPQMFLSTRLQLRGSDTFIVDLYAYRLRLLGLIEDSVARKLRRDQNSDRRYLAAYYENQSDVLRGRIIPFVNQSKMPKDERALLLRQLTEDTKASSESILNGLDSEHLIDLLEDLREDIKRFKSSPLAQLMSAIEPILTSEEARRLVGAGITTPNGFIWRTKFEFQRNALSGRSGISRERLDLLHFMTVVRWKRQVGWRAALATSVLAVWLTFVGLGSVYYKARNPSYRPLTAPVSVQFEEHQ
jgi:hypothetical protein